MPEVISKYFDKFKPGPTPIFRAYFRLLRAMGHAATFRSDCCNGSESITAPRMNSSLFDPLIKAGQTESIVFRSSA